LARRLADAGCELRADDVWSTWVGALFVAVVVAGLTGGFAVAVLAGAVVVIGPLAVLRMSRGRGPARVESSLPECLESLARALRSGASLRQAVGEAATTTPGALGEELDRVSDEAAHGMPLVAALEGLAVRRPLAGVQLAVAALCLGSETGGAQAQAVDGVAATIRERLAVAAEARALASQARMSALVIGLAPIGFAVFAASTDPRTTQFLLHTSAGLVLLVAGLALDGLGWAWMQRLCRVQG
jgi:tight adherence protein B